MEVTGCEEMKRNFIDPATLVLGATVASHSSAFETYPVKFLSISMPLRPILFVR